MKHKHHIVPKHAGGTDDPSNLVELTIAEHAEAHRILFEKYGRKQDFWAWHGLSGRIGKDEIMRQICSENGKRACEPGKYLDLIGRSKGGQTNKLSGHMSNLGKIATSSVDHQRKAGKAGAKAQHAKYPTLASDNGKKSNALRFSCDTCGRIMSPGNLGRHQKSTAHSGRSSIKFTQEILPGDSNELGEYDDSELCKT
jgi:hypothetical protein